MVNQLLNKKGIDIKSYIYCYYLVSAPFFSIHHPFGENIEFIRSKNDHFRNSVVL